MLYMQIYLYNTFTGVDRALSMHSVHAATDAGFYLRSTQYCFNYLENRDIQGI